MSLYKTAAKDLPISNLSVTERVFAGLTNRLDDIVLIDGVDERKLTAAEFMDQVKRLAGGLPKRDISKVRPWPSWRQTLQTIASSFMR